MENGSELSVQVVSSRDWTVGWNNGDLETQEGMVGKSMKFFLIGLSVVLTGMWSEVSFCGVLMGVQVVFVEGLMSIMVEERMLV